MSKQYIKSADQAAALFAALTQYAGQQEEAYIACLTGECRVKDIHFIGLGSDTAVAISAKVVARHAVLDMAVGVILCHTHPSGNPRPSKADIEQTTKLHDALALFDIDLVDHIILGDETFFSFESNKLIPLQK